MSYSTYLVSASFAISYENVELALQALKRNNKVKKEIGEDVLATCTKLNHVFEQVGFNLETNNAGVVDIYASDDTHYGAEEVLNAVAPFVEDNSWIQMVSEEQTSWVWFFKHGNLIVIDPFTVDVVLRQSLLDYVNNHLPPSPQ